MVTLMQGPQKDFHQVNYRMGLAFENGLETGSLIYQIMEMLIIHSFLLQIQVPTVCQALLVCWTEGIAGNRHKYLPSRSVCLVGERQKYK